MLTRWCHSINNHQQGSPQKFLVYSFAPSAGGGNHFFFFLLYLLLRRSSWAPVVHSGLRPHTDFPQRNKHNNVQRVKSLFPKRHCLVSTLVLWRQTSNKPRPVAQFVQRLLWLKTADQHIYLSLSNRRMYQSCSLPEDRGSPQTPAIKQLTVAVSFNHCVPYEKKGSWSSAVTDAVTLHIVQDRGN